MLVKSLMLLMSEVLIFGVVPVVVQELEANAYYYATAGWDRELPALGNRLSNRRAGAGYVDEYNEEHMQPRDGAFALHRSEVRALAADYTIIYSDSTHIKTLCEVSAHHS